MLGRRPPASRAGHMPQPAVLRAYLAVPKTIRTFGRMLPRARSVSRLCRQGWPLLSVFGHARGKAGCDAAGDSASHESVDPLRLRGMHPETRPQRSQLYKHLSRRLSLSPKGREAAGSELSPGACGRLSEAAGRLCGGIGCPRGRRGCRAVLRAANEV